MPKVHWQSLNETVGKEKFQLRYNGPLENSPFYCLTSPDGYAEGRIKPETPGGRVPYEYHSNKYGDIKGYCSNNNKAFYKLIVLWMNERYSDWNW